MDAIRLDGVSKRYAGKSATQALDRVSLAVQSKEIVTIVGPSGCGKSTLLRIIAGLDQPTSGTVSIGGRDVTAVPAQHRNIAMVFQSYALYPHMTCFENLALNLRLKKVGEEEITRRIYETAGLLQIEELLAKKPKELSGGQRQRVALGRALIRQPIAFLLDEPLSNLDAQLRERVRREMHSLFRKIDGTVVYVTHDQAEAMTLADRIVVLDHGQVQQAATPEEVYHRPANRFVASFFGSPPMNLFEGELENGCFRLGHVPLQAGIPESGKVTIGIRPEQIAFAETGPRARVEWMEHLGATHNIGVNVDGVKLTVTSSRPPPGETIHLDLQTDRIHVFDPESGASLTLAQPRGSTAV